MQGKNHVALALAIPMGAALVTGRADVLPADVPAWVGLVIGSLLPDMDGEGSIAYWGNWLPKYITPWPIRAGLNWLGQTVSRVIRAIFGHRNALHWPLVGLLIALGGYRLSLGWLIWLGVGYILHILGDSLTKSGVPLFGPLYQGDISFTPMVTGEFTEKVFGVLLWLFVGWQAVSFLPHSGYVWALLYRFGGELMR